MGIILKGLHTDAMVRIFAATTALLGLVACGDPTPPSRPAEPDAAGHRDAGQEFPRSGFGTITGDCDVLDTQLLASEPTLFRTSIDFQRVFRDADKAMLTRGGQVLLAQGNAGGSSLLSEVFAFEVLQRCEGASLLKTETEVQYDMQGKITDFLAKIDERKIGVSVTRAVGFPFDAPYPVSRAQTLLQKKLSDIIESSSHVSVNDRWEKQILAVLAYAPEHGEAVVAAWASLEASTKADTLIFVIETDGADEFIYCDGPCP